MDMGNVIPAHARWTFGIRYSVSALFLLQSSSSWCKILIVSAGSPLVFYAMGENFAVVRAMRLGLFRLPRIGQWVFLECIIITNRIFISRTAFVSPNTWHKSPRHPLAVHFPRGTILCRAPLLIPKASVNKQYRHKNRIEPYQEFVGPD